MSLKNPFAKMSKSHSNLNSQILITDSPELIRRKIRGALTDSRTGVSYDPAQRPGVANLLAIMSHMLDEAKTCEELAHECQGLTMRELKDRVADCVIAGLADVREEYGRVMDAGVEGYVEDVVRKGEREARESAGATMEVVRRAVGLA